MRQLVIVLVALTIPVSALANTMTRPTAEQEQVVENYVFTQSLSSLWPTVQKLMIDRKYELTDTEAGSFLTNWKVDSTNTIRHRYKVRAIAMEGGHCRVKFLREEALVEDPDNTITERDLGMEALLIKQVDPKMLKGLQVATVTEEAPVADSTPEPTPAATPVAKAKKAKKERTHKDKRATKTAKVEPKKAESKKVEPKKAKAVKVAKAEPKKVEPKKVAKVEPKKVAKVESTSTPAPTTSAQSSGVISDQDFRKVKREMKNTWKQLKVVQRVAPEHRFTSRQARQLVEILPVDSPDRIEVAGTLYPRVVDPENFHVVFSAFRPEELAKLGQRIAKQQ